MPTGFQSITDSGILQIDENYSAMSLIQAPTITINSYPSMTYYDIAGINPMCFLGNTGGGYVVGISRQSIGTNVWRFGFMASSGVSVKLYFFDKGPVTAGNSGLQVFSSAGELIYDSGNVVMSLVAVYQVSGGGSNSFTPPQNGRTHAAALSFSRSYVEQRPISHAPWDAYQEGLYVTSTQLTTNWVKTYSVGGEDPGSWRRDPDNSAPPQVLVVDVTSL